MTAASVSGSSRRTYRVGGCGVAVAADRASVADAIDGRLCGVRAAVSRADVLVEFRAVAAADAHVAEAAPSDARPVYDSEAVTTRYHDGCDRLYLACGDAARAECRAGEGYAVVSYVEAAAPELGWLLTHALLTVSLMEMLKRRGVYALHAAGVARQGSAMLLAGASGSGKTTLALALVRAGFDFLGDDLAFLVPRGPVLRVLGFPDQIDVTAETARLLPELTPFLARTPPAGREKRGLFVDEAYGAGRVRLGAAPEVLLLPSVSRDGRTRVRDVSRGEALLELAPNVLLTDRASSEAHLDALGCLVSGSRCYRLETGQDLARAAEILGELMPDRP